MSNIEVLIDNRQADDIEREHWIQFVQEHCREQKSKIHHFTFAYVEKRDNESLMDRRMKEQAE